ncbi:MAG: hypothetical protein FJ278_07850, partial [Planctomycetes bacterium]|nr:hypothetical protein [Planctomycetota bacterium]
MSIHVTAVLCVCLAVILPCPRLAAQEDKWRNLAVNPGFEELDEAGRLKAWRVPGKDWAVDEQVAHSGQRSLRAVREDPATYLLTSQPLDLKPGEMVSASVWVKSENVKVAKAEEGGSLGATMCLEWTDAQGKWLGGFYSFQGPLGTKEWQKVSAEGFAIPTDAGRVTVTLYLRKGLTGKAWFDDVSVTRYRKPLMSTLLLKPSYRGTFMPGGSQVGEVAIELNLDDHDLTPQDAEVVATLKAATGATCWTKRLAAPADKSVPFQFPAADMPADKSTLEIALKRKADGQALASESHTVAKLDASKLPRAYIDERHTLLVDGQPFFPLGWYTGAGPKSPLALKDLEDLSGGPFNCVMNYGVNGGSLDDIRAYLDSAQRLGVKVIYSIKDFYEGTQYFQKRVGPFVGEDAMTRGVVEAFKGHPAVLAWYLNDELPPSYLPRLRARYQLVKELDPDHPTWIVHYYSDAKSLAPYADTTDVLGVDPYPIGRSPVTYVSKSVSAANQAVQGHRALWVVPQAFAWWQYVPELRQKKRPPTAEELATKRAPTLPEVRSMTYLALIHGAKGLIYYSLYDLKALPDYAERWPAMKALAAELRGIESLILLGEAVSPSPLNTECKAVEFAARRHEGRLWLIAANVTAEPVQAKFALAGG